MGRIYRLLRAVLFSPRGADDLMKTIAIVGGGPAGAMAAERLACKSARESGIRGGVPSRILGNSLRVQVFEEKLGWEKPCGGGLTGKALRRYPFLGEATGQGRTVSEVEFIAPQGALVRFRLRQPLVVYSRGALNRLLLRRAEEAGAEIVGERILDFRRGAAGWELQSPRGTYRADYLVLAAGARSRLRGRLAEDFRARDFMLTFGYYIPAEDSLARVQFFEDFEGYAWALPRLDHLSVGICGKASKNRMSGLRERLRGFMRRFAYSAAGAAIYSHLLPALTVESWSGLRLAGRNWALAGDAGGLVDPITGEGIYYAMRSGELLAESLLGGTPELYPERVREEFGRALALGARLAHLFYHEGFLGAGVPTRMVQFAARSRKFMEVFQDLIAGSQSYIGLDVRLYLGLATSLFEIAAGFLGRALSRFRAAEA
jgi:flavin-dependent dehydrogenase